MLFDYQENSLKSGVYKLINLINNRIYIGSSKEFKERWKQHHYSLKNNKHSNKFLQADYNKCGEDAFKFEVLVVTNGDKQERLLIEEQYISQFYDKGENCYNICNRAISREGIISNNPLSTKEKKSISMKEAWKRMSEETKQKRNELIRVAHTTPEAKERIKSKWQDKNYREKMKKFSKQNGGWNKGMKFSQYSGINHPMYGKTRSQEIKEKISQSRKGKSAWNKGLTGYKMPPCSEETKEKLRQANIGKSISKEIREKISQSRKGKNAGKTSASAKVYEGFTLLSPDGTTYNRIECLTKFAKDNNLNMKCLWKLLKGKLKSSQGWKLI